MAKKVITDTPLYNFINDFHTVWKDNSSGRKNSMPFLSITRELSKLQMDTYEDKKNRKYDSELLNKFDNLLYDYSLYIDDTIPDSMSSSAESLTIKTEASAKNFRAQWVVGWINTRKNFEAAYTMAVTVSIYRFHPELLDLMTEKGLDIVKLINSESVIRQTMNILYAQLPDNIISEAFKNTVYENEELFFKMLFYGMLYLIAVSETDNSLNNKNTEYLYTDVFAGIIKGMEESFGNKYTASFTDYYTSLFNHTRILRNNKHDRSNKKKVETAFVTPDIEDEYDKAIIRKGKINVIMGVTGLGKSSLLYALSSGILYDRTEKIPGDDKKFVKLRRDLQQITNVPLKDTLPVYIYATDYVKRDGVLYPSVNQFAYGAQGITDDGSDLERLLALHDGPVMFLVDAIDEMNPERRKDFMKYLRQIKNKYYSSTFVITTRNIKQQVFDDLAAEVELLKIVHSENNIRKIISNYIKVFEKNNFSAEAFFDTMKKNSYLKNMLGNPYQIQKIISSTDHIKAVHPVYVYDSLISSIVKDKWGDLFPGLNSSAVTDVLRVLACRMTKEENTLIPSDKLAQILAECADTAGIRGGIDWEEFADAIAIRSGLLLYDDIENGFTFMSASFMNYLTAQWVYGQFSNKWRSLENRKATAGIEMNSYIYKGILADCLDKNKLSKEGLIMLFYYINYKESGGISGKTDTVRLLMELMLEKALFYGDDKQKAALVKLLKTEIPQSDMGYIDLRQKKCFAVVNKL